MSTQQKPIAKVTGEDSNVFITIGIASKALKAGMHDKAKEMSEKAFSASDYNEVIRILSEYVELT